MKEIKKQYMSFSAGFLGPRKPTHEGGPRQLDWDKIKTFIEENKADICEVSAGLAEDWSETSGVVWNSYKGYIPQDDTYVYGSSIWATPAIDVKYNDGKNKTYELWKHGTNAESYFNSED